ncbi:hypothetical protein C1752_09172 [Acaryochloris thomasi RCC1774]|uniref:Uncharacterized protein n=1 Tax=Acaryochloris thomasi RCC1774 TaxID=1764569 RepID=A0A2W1J8X1_9CYAN|nr:hypothetical protein [Acaryochloris thomasi]PZD70783.1 hypothetical protein C1752_09172 [Acaryochloris thomasi RCC1774]
MRAIEVARLQNILDRLEVGEPKDLLLRWIERQVKAMGETRFHQWVECDSSEDLGMLLHRRFNDAILSHLSELEDQFMRQNYMPIAQCLIQDGFQLGTDFSSYNGSLMVSEEAREYLLGATPPEGLKEIQLTLPAL